MNMWKSATFMLCEYYAKRSREYIRLEEYTTNTVGIDKFILLYLNTESDCWPQRAGACKALRILLDFWKVVCSHITST